MEMGPTQWPTLLPWRELTLWWSNMLMKMSSAGNSNDDYTSGEFESSGSLIRYYIPCLYSSPFQFQVLPSDSNRVLVSVPGLESGVCAQMPQTFTFDSKNGEAPESVAIMTPSGKDLKL